MAFDSRFIGLWKYSDDPKAGKTQIAQDPQSGDGFWYSVGGPTPYSLPDSNTLFYGAVNGQPFRWRRIGTEPGTSIIGHWRHDVEPTWPGDQGEDMFFRGDGTYIDCFDGDSEYINGTFELSQDANGLYLSATEYRERLQTSANAFTLTSTDGTVQSGTFVFGVDPNSGKDTVTLTYVDPPGVIATMTRV